MNIRYAAFVASSSLLILFQGCSTQTERPQPVEGTESPIRVADGSFTLTWNGTITAKTHGNMKDFILDAPDGSYVESMHIEGCDAKPMPTGCSADPVLPLRNESDWTMVMKNESKFDHDPAREPKILLTLHENADTFDPHRIYVQNAYFKGATLRTGKPEKGKQDLSCPTNPPAGQKCTLIVDYFKTNK